MLNIVRAFILTFLIFLSSFSISSPVLAAGDFTNTCHDIDLIQGITLRAICKTGDGGENYTTINLNNHIANVNGTLQWTLSGGRFIETCEIPRIINYNIYRFGAFCYDIQRLKRFAFITLNDHITNVRGYLKYIDENGTVHDEL